MQRFSEIDLCYNFEYNFILHLMFKLFCTKSQNGLKNHKLHGITPPQQKNKKIKKTKINADSLFLITYSKHKQQFNVNLITSSRYKAREGHATRIGRHLQGRLQWFPKSTLFQIYFFVWFVVFKFFCKKSTLKPYTCMKNCAILLKKY